MGILTILIQHLVALIENEVLQVGEAKDLVTDEGIDTAGSSNDDVRVSVLVLQHSDVLLDRSSAVEDADLDVRQELCEAIVLVLDLVCQFTGVTHD